MPTNVVLLARLKDIPSEDTLRDLRDRLIRDLSLDPEDHFYNDGPMVIVKEESGPVPTRAMPDDRDCWINVNFLRSYYGLGYERGDLNLFLVCAEWLERNVPGCEVWYGHDVEDENLHRFDAPVRARFLRYFNLVGSEPFYSKDKERREQLRALWQD